MIQEPIHTHKQKTDYTAEQQDQRPFEMDCSLKRSCFLEGTRLCWLISAVEIDVFITPCYLFCTKKATVPGEVWEESTTLQIAFLELKRADLWRRLLQKCTAI